MDPRLGMMVSPPKIALWCLAAQHDKERAMLTISGLTYRIGGRLLLENASATIPAGAKVGLVGRNGVGKSTLFKLIQRWRPWERPCGTIRIIAIRIT